MSRAVCSVEAEPCDDCNPIRLENRWLHSAGCPVAVNLLRDAAADRVWFAANQQTDVRHRPLTWAEAVIVRRYLTAAQRASDHHTLDTEYLGVVVNRNDNGTRVRRFVGEVLVLSDSTGDQVELPPSLQVLDGRRSIRVLAGSGAVAR